ncbi:RNA polymerase sigma-70 factor (ECF subfamily) [Dysgonomonas hofstadii]|uniref:RNA polymerase sigma-70 factor (ECF subfamily) n=1 Tax=Dysgonomonas hofstadii TaxID=637886 RepID=A0A840CJS5_9BACT|nr:RNA polymerase sigma-70 factor [Dysgonomonas hofstadii]MBB4036307.1 RNA polymerase sigma-70 factor (ECF subfamily) [Dysgonomonas hofstadii]
MGEKELISQLKEGSEAAFDKIYDLYGARLYGYCMQYTKSREDSEEIMQDVFIKLWQNKEKIIQTDTLRSLIFKIAKFQLINKYKSNLNSFSFETYVDFYNEKKLSIDNTHHAIEYDDFCRLLENALKALPETQRKVIEYSKLKQYSNQEIADKLQLKEQTIKNQLSIGLKALQQELQKHLPWTIVLLIVKNILSIGTDL